VAAVCWSIGLALLQIRTRQSFSLGDLLVFMTAIAGTFPLWKAIGFWPYLGENRWSHELFSFETPAFLTVS
jgi:hypothetical protein